MCVKDFGAGGHELDERESLPAGTGERLDAGLYRLAVHARRSIDTALALVLEGQVNTI